ncbi:efflux RND transporter permease subunit [Paremcibacter congregatus]|mgnify:CR=1 FL=1|uniref:efflux RND transporter permease subunit n=1 Tax=Paremcibacter congregatus TaxID=2043170 RepID=UPI0030EF4DE2|tara:strand:+ start:15529 stop:18651 length:3123 start_codon:yes stop_codon:yes gene_type:complete
MTWTEKSLKNPAAVAVIVAVIFLFGGYSVTQLPVQLFPNIEYPQLGIFTSWRSASPVEIESEITEPLEEVLQGIPGLKEMSVNSNQGAAFINLQFTMEADMDKVVLDVISRLNRLRPLPVDADKPVLFLGGGGGSNDTLIYYFMQKLPDNPRAIDEYMTFTQDRIIPLFEAIPGVAQVNNQTNLPEEELQITFDPYRAAELGIDVADMAAAVGRSRDLSGGFIENGRRRYTLRFMGRYTPEDLKSLVLEWRDSGPIKLGDIAEITVSRGKQTDIGIQNGNPALSLQITRENGANVLETIQKVNALADELNQGILKNNGLFMQKSFDPSVFIKRATGLLSGNLILGVFFAIGILWWFLRQSRATLIIAITIPVCLLATFIVLYMAGRSVNVISLAGLAFATGMVLDAAIVVMENICRLRENGTKTDAACTIGARQVWGALVASTATTVAIFLPVMLLKDVEGQLFSDLALTIAIAVSVSLFVAVTVLPVANKHFMKGNLPKDKNYKIWQKLSGRIMSLTRTTKHRMAWITSLIAVSIVGTYLMFPKLDYLPPVKRDAVDVFFRFPAGMSSDVLLKEIVPVLTKRMEPYVTGAKEPALKNYYLITFTNFNGGTMGIRAKDQSRVKELERIVREEIIADLPDVQTFASQGNLFGGFGGSGNIAIHLQSTDSAALANASLKTSEYVTDALPTAQVNPAQNPEQAQPLLSIVPDDRRIQEAGWSRSQLGRVIQTTGNGLFVGEFFDGEKRMNIILKTPENTSPEEIAAVPLATPNGGIMQLGELARLDQTVGPQQIRRVNGRRTMTFNVSPPEGMPLQEAMEIIRRDVEPKILADLGDGGSVIYGGSADSLKNAIASLGSNFLLAFGLLFMILAALFRSLKDASLVVISIPLAAVGGIAAIRILGLFTTQSLDLLTMIGFIILLGLVVNNAILLVMQTRAGEAEGLDRQASVQQALELRLRPIFMSTLTSIFGMLPLLLFPGEGSAIYRGLAASIVGGMAVSTVFTLILLPSLLQLGKAQKVPKLIIDNKTDSPSLQDRLVGVGE